MRHYSRIAAALLTAITAAPVTAALLFTPAAHADTPGCVQQPWWYGSALRQTTRTICDGPVQADGSWTRGRNFYAPAAWVPYTCSWSRWGGYCSGGYWLPIFNTGVETYPVTADTVLPDEPGHIDQ